MSSHEPNETDIDIQDRMGYVDTGPSQRNNGNTISNNNSNGNSNNNGHHKVATSSSAHLVIKEPKPQRQVNIPITTPGEKKRATFKPEIQTRRSNSIDLLTVPTSQNVPSFNLPSTPNYYQDNRPPPAPSTMRMSYHEEPLERPNREEIKDMMVSKLYELADMLKDFNIEDEPNYRPRPIPSKSDPSQQDRRYFKNKTGNFPEEQPPRRSPYQQRRDYYPYYDGPPPMYDYPQEDYYYPAPPLPPVVPQQRQGYRPRRKSYGNLREEENSNRLTRNNSRGNMRQRMYDTRYDTYQDAPPPQPQPTNRHFYQPRHYSPDNYY